MSLDEALLTGAAGSSVFVLREGKLRFQEVEVLHRDADAVIVRGLTPGEQVLAETRCPGPTKECWSRTSSPEPWKG